MNRFKLACIGALSSVSLYGEHFLTFIMPCYNSERTVIESLDSIYNQKNLRVSFEVICCDDGSTDSTRTLLEEYAQQHPSLKVLVHNSNQGGAEARNTCVYNSRGDIIFCLDSDNVLEPDSVQALIDLMDETGCEGASFAEIWFFYDMPNGEKNRSSTWIYHAPNNRSVLKDLVTVFHVPASSGNYLYTRESFDRAGGYLTTPDAGGAFDAWTFGFRQAATGTVIAVLPGSHYLHRIWRDRDSYYCREQKNGNNGRNGFAVLREFMDFFDEQTQKLLMNNPDPRSFFDIVNNHLIRLAQ